MTCSCFTMTCSDGSRVIQTSCVWSRSQVFQKQKKMARRMPPEFFLTGPANHSRFYKNKKINFCPHPVCSSVSVAVRVHWVSFAYKTGIFRTRQSSILNLCDIGLQDWWSFFLFHQLYCCSILKPTLTFWQVRHPIKKPRTVLTHSG